MGTSPIPQIDRGGEEGGGSDVENEIAVEEEEEIVENQNDQHNLEDVGGGGEDVGRRGCEHNYKSDIKIKRDKFHYLIYCTSCFSYTVSSD